MSKVMQFNINDLQEDNDKIMQLEQLSKSNTKLIDEDIEMLLRNLSFLVRKKIADYEGFDMREYLYSSKCDLAQSMICYYLNKLGISVNPVNTNEIIPGVCGHSFVIARFESTNGEKIFLIDPTYIQFFDEENCDINKFVIIDGKVCIAPSPGFFVIEDGSEKKIMPLLTDGYIEFTEEVAKIYGDSFFRTKQGTLLSQINNNRASGSNYIAWFQHYTSSLSKKEKELEDMDLLINLISDEKDKAK